MVVSRGCRVSAAKMPRGIRMVVHQRAGAPRGQIQALLWFLQFAFAGAASAIHNSRTMSTPSLPDTHSYSHSFQG